MINNKLKSILNNWLPVGIVLILLHPIYYRRLALIDLVKFSNDDIHFDRFLSIWSNRFLGRYDIPTPETLIKGLSELATPTGHTAQILFYVIVYVIGYFGFKRVLQQLNLNEWIVRYLPILYVINPHTYIYSTLSILSYALIPWFALYFYKLLTKQYSYKQGLIISIIIAVCSANVQITFWNFVWFYIFGLIWVIQNKNKTINYLKIVAHSMLGLAFNLPFLFLLFGYLGSDLSAIPIKDGMIGCYKAVFWNLSRIGADGCNIMEGMGYIQDRWWTIPGYIIPFIILLAATLVFKNKAKINKNQSLFIRQGIIVITSVISISLIIRYELINNLIESGNPFVLSIRNPVKILEPMVFHYIVIFGVALNIVYNNSFLKNNLKPRALVTIFILLCLVIYNKNFLHKDWNYQSMNNGTYWVAYDQEASFYATNKYDKLDNYLDQNLNNEYALHLPMDFAIEWKVNDARQIFKDNDDVLRNGSDFQLLDSIYKNVCSNSIINITNLNLNLNYLIIDNNPHTHFDHDNPRTAEYYQDGTCQIETDHILHLWADNDYLHEIAQDYPVSYEDEDYTVYKLSDKITPLISSVDQKIEYQKNRTGTEYKIEYSELLDNNIKLLQLHDPRWSIKKEGSKEKVFATEKDFVNNFDISGLGAKEGDTLIIQYEPQKQYTTLLSISGAIILLSLSPLAIQAIRRNVTKPSPKNLRLE